MPTFIDNSANLLSNINQDERKVDMAPAIAMKAPRIAPLMLIAQRPTIPYGISEKGAKTVKFNTRTVINYEYKWLEDEVRTRSSQVNGTTFDTNSIQITVDDASIFQIGDLVDVVTTGEILRVNSSDTTNDIISVTRSWGSTAAGALADNSVLLVVGNVNAENARAREASDVITTTKVNYIQTTRHPFAGSHATERSELYGGNQRSYKRKKFFLEHLLDVEASCWFSEGNEGSEFNGSGIEYSTKGLLELLTENVTAAGGTLSKSTWHTWLKSIFTYGSDEKFIFASPTVANAVSNFAGNDASAPKSSIYVQNLANVFGVNIFTYVSKFGTVHIIMHGMLSANTAAVYDGYAVAVDPEHLQMVHVRGGDKFTMYTDIQESDRAGWKDEYRTDFGIQYDTISTGGVLTGVTG